MWNSLPDDVIDADTNYTFKNRLDNYLSNLICLSNFNTDLIGTGSLPKQSIASEV